MEPDVQGTSGCR